MRLLAKSFKSLPHGDRNRLCANARRAAGFISGEWRAAAPPGDTGATRGLGNRLAIVGLALPIFLTWGLPGCRRAPPSEEERLRREGFVAVVGASQSDPVWPLLQAGAERCRRDLDSLPVRFAAPAQLSPNAQMNLIEDLRKEGMRGLCIQVIDAKALEPKLRSLHTSGIQIVTMMTPAADRGRVSHWGVDDRQVGAAVARTLVEALGGKGTAAVLHAGERSAAALDRLDGFKLEMGKQFGVRVLAYHVCDTDPARAREIMKNWNDRYPYMGAWAILGHWPLMGLDPGQRVAPEGCKVIAADPCPPVWPAMKSGACYACVGACYDQIGYAALSDCFRASLGYRVEQAAEYAAIEVVYASSCDAFLERWNRRELCPRRAREPLRFEQPGGDFRP